MCTIFSGMRTNPKPPKRPGARRSRPASEDAILNFIADSLRDQGRPPTIREIGAAFHIASTNGVRYYLDRLEASGKIRRDRWTSRGIELQTIQGRDGESREPVPAPGLAPSTRPAPAGRTAAPARATTPTRRAGINEPLEIPLLGRVAAGAPILAEENIEDTLIVDGALVRPGKHFALRVRGDSMKNAGIFDGDIVIVRHEAPVRSGEIAVVVIGEEATVKRYFPRRDKILLLPENDEYEPIEVRPADPETRVAGKVVGVFRQLG
jgi:repressor LexA